MLGRDGSAPLAIFKGQNAAAAPDRDTAPL